MSHENLAVQLADRPTNIFPLRAKIRAGVSVFPNGWFPLPLPPPPFRPLARDKIHANNEGIKMMGRNEISVLYFPDNLRKPDLQMHRKIAKVRRATRKLARFSLFRGIMRATMHASRLSRDDLRDDCDRIIARLIINLKRRCSCPFVRMLYPTSY